MGWVVALGAVLGEAWMGARWAKRRLGYPLSSDQRGRVALYYTTFCTFPLAGAAISLFVSRVPLPIAEQVDRLSHARTALLLVAVLLALASLALLRYLLLALFSPRPAVVPTPHTSS